MKLSRQHSLSFDVLQDIAPVAGLVDFPFVMLVHHAAAPPSPAMYVSFRRVRTWSARKHRCSEEPSGWTPAPASANGPASDFEPHACHCRSRAQASPRPTYERPAWGASRPAD
jgi:hypothetical protein